MTTSDAGWFHAAYTRYGDERNTALLFIHGVRLGREIWKPHALALADEYSIVTLDLPGHGKLAALPFKTPTVEALLAHIVEDVLGKPPIVIGYSLGGYVAMQFAHDYPEHTAGLVLADCTLDLAGWLRHPYNWAVRGRWTVPTRSVRRTLALLFRLTVHHRIAKTIVPLRFKRALVANSRAFKRIETFSGRLSKYRRPVLIVNGEWDFIFRADEQKFARAANAELGLIKRTDHIAPLRRPEEFAALVRQFARGVYAAGDSPHAQTSNVDTL
ncbi:MAG TPA: alpha/beta hydrolase [Candidatus Baltobacteraceae bacterium]